MSNSSSNGCERKVSSTIKTSASTGAGAVDEDVFRSSFITSISVNVYSSKELTETIGRIKDNLSVNPEEWEKRVDALKTLRAVITSGAAQFDDFFPSLKTLESLVDGCLKDLRSAVVREACITVAYLSQELRNRFDRFAETILQNLIALMSNSAKIMASSGIVAMRFILMNTHSPRLLPIIAGSMTCKSNVTRKCICEFLEIIFGAWPVNVLEKHVGLLQDTLRRGINDADQEARGFSRRAFPSFAAKFPDQASSLLQSLDAQKRKLIEKDLLDAGLSGLSSNSELSHSRSQTRVATNPVTRRPTKPVLGTTAIGVNGARSRPPVTTLNDYSAAGRYMRIGSVVSSTDSRGRLSNRKTVSQSQPTSREVSPSRLAYFPYGINEGIPNQPYNPAGYAGSRNGTVDTRTTPKAIGTSYRSGAATRVPRSQGTSREPSPTRSVTGGYTGSDRQGMYDHSRFGPRAMTLTGPRNRGRASFGAMSDCGDSADLFHPNNRQAFESDDNFSETSSQCSERSGRSGPGYARQQSIRFTSNFKEILVQLSGSQWSDRKDGLVNLQNYMRSGSTLSPDDIRRLTEIFAKMFTDSQSKVVSLFMDTLQFFIKEYNPMLRDWLYTLLIRLLNRQGAEVLGSHQKAIQETLFVLRSHFPLNLQFATCCRFIMDNTQAPNMKVKGCLLEYLKDLILMMSPDVISTPSQEMSSAIARIITWSAEPKSADVRRMASRVVIKLHDLNSTSFSSILQSLPRAVQDRATEVLKAYHKTALGGSGGIPSAADGIQSAPSWKSSSVDHHSQGSIGQHSPAPSDPGRLSPETLNSMIRQTTEGLQSLTTGIQPPGSGLMRRISAGPVLNSSPFDSRVSVNMDGGNNNVPAGVLRTVQSNELTGDIVPTSVPNSYAQPANISPYSPGGGLSFDQGDGPKLRKPVIGYQTLRKIREMPPEDIMCEILQELSNHNERHEQRKACMLKLIKFLREGLICNWDEYFKPTLLILLEILGDDSYETRALALRVLQELVRTKPDLFHEFACLFVIKVLEACRDTEKTVIRAAEECAKTVAQYLPSDLCFSVLTPLINDHAMRINLPAVKMQEHVVRHSSADMVNDVMEVIIPGLIVGCNHEDSAMRKASIFCLVAIALKIGDSIWGYLTDLHISKRRLLKMYIDRELKPTQATGESLDTRS